MTKFRTGLLIVAGLVVTAAVAGAIGAGAAIALVKTSYNARPDAGIRSELAVHSDVLGETMLLGVRLPLEYASDPERRFPVLWVLDGHSRGDEVHRATQTLSRIGAAEPSIVVEVPSSGSGRTEDFTPPPEMIGDGDGQGDRFLRFLETEAIPAVEDAFRTDSVRVLVGHSLGGLFVLYSLVERPSLFDARFAFSPSVWVGGQAIVPALGSTLQRPDTMETFLYVSLGSQEGNRMLAGFEAVRATLQSEAPPGLAWYADITPGANHRSNPALSYPVAASRYWTRR